MLVIYFGPFDTYLHGNALALSFFLFLFSRSVDTGKFWSCNTAILEFNPATHVGTGLIRHSQYLNTNTLEICVHSCKINGPEYTRR